MVNGQIHPVGIGQGIVGKESHGGNVRGDHMIRDELRRSGIGGKVGSSGVGKAGIGQQVGRFAQGPETGAQRRCAAHGIPVGPDVGENQNPVQGTQQVCRFQNTQHEPSSVSPLPRDSSSCSTFRSTSRMWAPWAMESSAMNCSSGV